MKTAVRYFSKLGNTKKIAEAILLCAYASYKRQNRGRA